MKTQLTPHELRSLSESGQLAEQEKKKQEIEKERNQQHLADLQEAQDRIKESDDKMTQAALRGEREAQVCVLRGGIHFDREFRRNQSIEFLGTIGKIVYDHFTQRGFKVEFRHWMDEMRIGELESDGGYEVVVIW